MKSVKKAAYKLFAFNYRLGCVFTKAGKYNIFLVETNDASETGNIGAVRNNLMKTGDYNFTCFSANFREKVEKGEPKALIGMFFALPFKMAKCSVIFMDNGFLPLAYCKVRKGTKVVQLWHGTGSLKRFGQDVNKGDLAEAEKAIGANIDMVTVNAKCQINQYASAFGVDRSKVVVTGLPRTDALISMAKLPKDKLCKKISELKSRIGESCGFDLSGKSLILYAPTFRDSEVDAPKLHLDVNKIIELLPENVIILVRLHPFVYRAYKESGIFNDRIINVSDYGSLNDLLAASDMLITDYSSVFFDYSVFDRPTYFFADDLAEFSERGRGFYMDYSEVPGEIFSDEGKLASSINRDLIGHEPQELKTKRQQFVKKYYHYLDGKSAERVVQATEGVVNAKQRI